MFSFLSISRKHDYKANVGFVSYDSVVSILFLSESRTLLKYRTAKRGYEARYHMLGAVRISRVVCVLCIFKGFETFFMIFLVRILMFFY